MLELVIKIHTLFISTRMASCWSLQHKKKNMVDPSMMENSITLKLNVFLRKKLNGHCTLIEESLADIYGRFVAIAIFNVSAVDAFTLTLDQTSSSSQPTFMLITDVTGTLLHQQNWCTLKLRF